MLARPQHRPSPRPSTSVAQIAALVRSLRDLARPEFESALKPICKGEHLGTKEQLHLRRLKILLNFVARNSRTSPPYFLGSGAPKFINFLVSAFDGTERIHIPRPSGAIMHAEVAIGNSVIELGDANEQYPQRAMTAHLYVPDADAVYAQALRAGATPVTPPNTAPYGDRAATVKDPFGNTWFLATHFGTGRP